MRFDKKNTIPNILVIGDLIVDHYLWGTCERISPEAPVQIIDVIRESNVLGGAGNVATNLISLGANVSVISVIGDCKISDELKALFLKKNLTPDFLIKEQNRKSSRKTRLISSQQQVVRFDVESTENINSDSEKLLIAFYKELISKFDAVVLSDYGKGVLTANVTQKIINEANKKNIKVLVDPKGTNFSKYKSAYLLTPNKKEVFHAIGIDINDDKSLALALKTLKNEFDLNISLITLSENGIAFLDNLKTIKHPTQSRQVFDVTGAGDTVIAALAYCLSKGLNINDSARFANLAAGVVVGKVGAATATLDEIKDLESSLHQSRCFEHVKDTEEIIEIVYKLRKENKNIVFTNGCFDILHIGHVTYLEEAKKLGDTLIVGVNSDKSVKRLKGSDRPINPIEDRTCVLGALECVDYVLTFDEDTPIDLIKLIVPDILVKGSDYKETEVVGHDIAGKVVLINYINNKSTSNIIKKIKNE